MVRLPLPDRSPGPVGRPDRGIAVSTPAGGSRSRHFRRTKDASTMAARLAVNQISKVFDGRRGGGSLTVLDRIQFEAEPGEFISIIGPSGCGKTTLMRIVQGRDQPPYGNVTFDGKPVSAPDRHRAVV